MRIITKDDLKSKMVKLKDVVWHQVGQMKSVRDAIAMEPNYDKEEFCLDCLNAIDKIYSIEGQSITKRNLKEPSWKHFKESINTIWHNLKSENLFLRSYYYDGKGWIKLKVDNDTPKEVFDKLGIQSKDRIIIRIEKHDERLEEDSKRLGYQPKGYLPKPSND